MTEVHMRELHSRARVLRRGRCCCTAEVRVFSGCRLFSGLRLFIGLRPLQRASSRARAALGFFSTRSQKQHTPALHMAGREAAGRTRLLVDADEPGAARAHHRVGP
eukprot:309856-Prymnesium_polylepis.1